MTTEEFSNGFDTLVSSYRRFKDFDNKEELDSIEFDEFEKSQFLTKAQEQTVTELYNGTLLDGFEGTEQSRRYLDTLLDRKEISLSDSEDADFVPRSGLKYYKANLSIYNMMFIVYESVSFNDSTLSCQGTSTVPIVPVRYDELTKIVRNPFRGPNTSRVLRVDSGDDKIELISKYALSTYYVEFITKPSPIILVALSGNLSIDGKQAKATCLLDSSLHRIILERAVRMAMASKAPSVTSKDK